MQNNPGRSIWYILLFLLCLQGEWLSAQSFPDFSMQGKSIPELRREADQLPYESLFHFSNGLFLQKNADGGAKPTDWQTQGGAARPFQLKELAFFCRLEFKLEKKVRFPVKVRLGEVQYVEQLEGKY